MKTGGNPSGEIRQPAPDAADVLEHEHRIDEPPFNVPDADAVHLQGLGLTDRWLDWRNMVSNVHTRRRVN